MITLGVPTNQGPGFRQIAFVDTHRGVGGTATESRGSGEVLSRSRSTGNEGASGDGTQRSGSVEELSYQPGLVRNRFSSGTQSDACFFGHPRS
jgi:hypothetical protein